MRTISELISGVGGAGNGTAEVYTRNGGATATWYEDFEGTTAHTTGDPIDLDSQGGAVAYVNQEVLVRVKDSTGTVVREFVSAGAAPGVEVSSQSFTGSDYLSGQSGVLKPTTAQAVFDLWKTNAGGLDWKVLTHAATSSTQTLKAIGAAHHRIFVVTDPAYGAKGDGTTDDTAAINAAVAAATAASGGIIYFPPGTYRVTATIGSITADTSLLGAGTANSVISMDHATAGVLTYGSGTVNVYQFIKGLTITCQQANTGYMIFHGTALWLWIEDCIIGHGTFANGSCIDQNGSSSKTVLVSTSLLLGTGVAAASQWVDGDTTAGNVWLFGCNVFAPTASWSPTDGGVNAYKIVAVGTTFTLSPLTGGAGTCLVAPGDGQLYVGACEFSDDGSGNFAAMGLSAAPTVDARVFDLGNAFSCNLGVSVSDPGALADERVLALSRDAKVFYSDVTGGAPATTPEATSQVSAYVFEVTDATAFTLTLTPLYEGQKLSLHWLNSSGGTTGNLALSGNVKWEGTTTLTIGQHMTAHFVAVRDTTNTDTLTFYQLGTRVKV